MRNFILCIWDDDALVPKVDTPTEGFYVMLLKLHE